MAYLIPTEAFERLKSNTVKAVKGHFPVKGKKHTLTAVDVSIDDTKDIEDIHGQKDAKEKGRSWSVPIRAQLHLTDNATGKVVDKREVTVGQLPKVTRRHSYNVDGNEKQVNNQFRLKSGVYTRIKNNGELASQWNLARGPNFEMNFAPKTRRMELRVAGNSIPLYPMMKVLGVDDDAMQKAWGKEILSANMVGRGRQTQQAYIDQAIHKAYRALHKKKAETIPEAVEGILDTFNRTILRPDSTEVTLGKPYDTVSGAALLSGTENILKVSRREKDPDNRDSLVFKDFLATEDLLAERISKSTRQDIKRKLTAKLDKGKKIKEMVNPDTFGRTIKAFFTNSALSERPDQMNPVQFIVGARRTTLGGEGGITNPYRIPEGARSVDPSAAGFLDPVHTPENPRIGTVLQMGSAAKKVGKEIKTRVYNTKTGRTEYISPSQALSANLAFGDQYRWVNGKPKPVGRIVKITDKAGDFSTARLSEVDYIIRSPKGMFDISTNLIPFLQNDQGNRTSVASRQLEQAVPLVAREAPLVQVKGEAADTWEQALGRFNSHVSRVGGTVSRVTRDSIFIKGDDGKSHKIPLYDDFPLNDNKSVLNSVPTVKAGDTVHPGQRVADTNFTRDGTLAIGTNLRVAYMPYMGYNFDDGVVVSESAAEKLRSEHMLRENIKADKNTILSKAKFFAHAAGQYDIAQADQLDDAGVVKPGTTVNNGDILIGAMRREQWRPEHDLLAKFSKKIIPQVRVTPQVWDKEYPGVVSKVVRHGKETTVYVKAQAPVQVGDKIAGRHGNKGICFDDLTEVLTNQGWKFFDDLGCSEEVCSLNQETNSIEFQAPSNYTQFHYEGQMYLYEGRRLNLCTTPEHRHFVRTRRGEYKLESAEDCFGLPRIHLRTGNWDGQELHEITIPGRSEGAGRHKKFFDSKSYDADAFLAFFGFWVTEGCVGQGKVNIGQCKKTNPETYQEIVEAVEALGYEPWKYDTTIGFSDPRLAEWLSQFGKAKKKWIPREFLGATQHQLKILAEALFGGDGGIYFREKDNHTRFELFTSSPRLADDYQELALKLGWSANIKPQPGEYGTEYVVRWSMKDEVWTNNDKRYSNESWTHYDGNVYCVEVPNHVIYVRRKGIPVWSGNCTKILPDHEMPKLQSGDHIEVLLNPAGVPGRINLGQVLETAASKIARKTGKPYIVNNFDPDVPNYTKKVMEDLKKHGLSDTEILLDPKTDRPIKSHPILAGEQFILKLHHTAEGGIKARSRGAYDVNEQPKKGPTGKAQTFDAAGLYALLAHGARANIREILTVKSDKNDDYWNALQSGESLPPPKIPFAYKKFEGYLRGMGVNVEKDGSKISLAPLTDRQVLAMSAGELKNPGLGVKGKSVKPEKGSIFDTEVTGTQLKDGTLVLGKKWSHFPLPERSPNPIFEQPIRTLLGLSQKRFKDIISGADTINGTSGPAALSDALSGINVEKELGAANEEIPKAAKSRLSALRKKAKYLSALKETGLSPREAYTMKYVPVLPPVMRPVSILPNGDLHTDDVNDLYRGLAQTGQQLSSSEVRSGEIPVDADGGRNQLWTELYDGLKALTLTGKSRGHELHKKGIIEMIAGTGSPKLGYFQRKIIGKRQDLSMRGVIVPEPELGIDELGIPEGAAKEIYRPFIQRRMVRQGYTPGAASEAIKNNTKEATYALQDEMEDRPILLKRDPVLHKYGVQAFKPRIVRGSAVQIHPLATSGYNADFDGDKMNAYVPVSNEAVKEAFNMLPSRNLFSPSTGKLMYTPTQESMMGLYDLSKFGKRTKHRFKNVEEAARAVQAGKMYYTDVVTIDDPSLTAVRVDPKTPMAKAAAAPIRTTIGRLMLQSTIPEKMRSQKFLTDPNISLDEKRLNSLLSSVARTTDNQEFSASADKLKDMGYRHSTGFSFGLKDLLVDNKFRDAVFAQARDAESAIRKKETNKDKRDQKLVKLYEMVGAKVLPEAKKRIESSDNRLYDWVKSGAKGTWSQFHQMTVAPVQVVDSSGKKLPVPIDKSYAEGLDSAAYYAAMYGARMGVVGRVKGTAKPGALTKQLMQTAMGTIITSNDCGTNKGQVHNIDDPHALASSSGPAEEVTKVSSQVEL